MLMVLSEEQVAMRLPYQSKLMSWIMSWLRVAMSSTGEVGKSVGYYSMRVGVGV